MMNVMPSDPRIDELDEPPDSARPKERETAPPPFEPEVFAQDVEGAGSRVTQPPAPTFEMLRDSCKSMSAADAIMDGEVGPDDPSSAAIKAAAPIPPPSPHLRKPPPVPPRRA
jgi:hypothetical protein